MKKITAIIISFAAMILLCTSVAAYSGGMLSPAMRILSEDETMIKSALVSGDITFSENDFIRAVGGEVNYIISSSAKGRLPQRDSVKIRRKAVEHSIPCLTSLDTANALAESLMSEYSEENTELVELKDMKR